MGGKVCRVAPGAVHLLGGGGACARVCGCAGSSRWARLPVDADSRHVAPAQDHAAGVQRSHAHPPHRPATRRESRGRLGTEGATCIYQSSIRRPWSQFLCYLANSSNSCWICAIWENLTNSCYFCYYFFFFFFFKATIFHNSDKSLITFVLFRVISPIHVYFFLFFIFIFLFFIFC